VKSNSAFAHLFSREFAVDTFIAASFSLVQVIVTLLAATMILGARAEEASGRLELLFAEPLSRVRWLLSRATLAAGTALMLALISAVALWAGVSMSGEHVPFGSLIEAGLNCIPLIVVSTGAAVALLALAPRAVSLIYAPIAIAYLWEALGTALKAPDWSLYLSPYHALSPVPAEPFAYLPATILTVIGLALAVVGASVFRGRDLVSG
jgi:polyether ionophore transport system permease protein